MQMVHAHVSRMQKNIYTYAGINFNPLEQIAIGKLSKIWRRMETSELAEVGETWS